MNEKETKIDAEKPQSKEYFDLVILLIDFISVKA